MFNAKARREGCYNNTVKDLMKTEKINSYDKFTIDASNSSDNSTIKDDLSSNVRSRTPTTIYMYTSN